jgi:hypothetical protein
VDLGAIIIFGVAGALLALGARNMFKKPASQSNNVETKDSSPKGSEDEETQNVDTGGLIALAGCASVTFGLLAIAAGLVAVLFFLLIVLL